MIELTDVVKSFAGPWYLGSRPIRALDGVSLRASAGEALGVVGLNGAGKSTLLKVLLGFVRVDRGDVAIEGVPPREYVESHGIAYVPERIAIPRHWSVRGALGAYAMLGDLGEDAWEQVDRALERLGLRSLADRQVGTLSKGNLQRLAIAQALLGSRRIMVLDEPTDGLDPVWIVELRSIIREWRDGDPARCLVMASHNLPEIERMCDRTVLLHNGRVEGELRSGGREGVLEDSFLERVQALEEARP